MNLPGKKGPGLALLIEAPSEGGAAKGEKSSGPDRAARAAFRDLRRALDEGDEEKGSRVLSALLKMR